MRKTTRQLIRETLLEASNIGGNDTLTAEQRYDVLEGMGTRLFSSINEPTPAVGAAGEAVAWWCQFNGSAMTDATTEAQRVEDWERRGRKIRPLVFGDVEQPSVSPPGVSPLGGDRAPHGLAGEGVTDERLFAMAYKGWAFLRTQCFEGDHGTLNTVEYDDFVDALKAALTTRPTSEGREDA